MSRHQEYDSWEQIPDDELVLMISPEMAAAFVHDEPADTKECAARGDGGPHEFSVSRCRFCDRPPRRSL